MSSRPLPPLPERLLEILRFTAERVEDCPACGKQIFFVRQQSDHLVPYAADGLNHVLHCTGKEPAV